MKIESLQDVFEFYRKSNNNMSLKRWQINKILDQYNWDKDRLFRETQDIVDGIGETQPLRMTMGGETFMNQMDDEEAEFLRNLIEGGDEEDEYDDDKSSLRNEGQFEIIITTPIVKADDFSEWQEEVMRMLDVMNWLDGETYVTRSHVNHEVTEDGDVEFIMEVHAYTDEREEIEMDKLYEQCIEYCGEFKIRANLKKSNDDFTIFINLIEIPD